MIRVFRSHQLVKEHDPGSRHFCHNGTCVCDHPWHAGARCAQCPCDMSQLREVAEGTAVVMEPGGGIHYYEPGEWHAIGSGVCGGPGDEACEVCRTC